MVNSSITNKNADFDGVIHPIEGPMIHHVIRVPENICTIFRTGKGAVRILCSINGADEFPCALNPREGNYVIIASKQLIKTHKLLPGAPFKVQIRTDPNDGLELPEELQEVLDQDDFFRSLFDALLPGHKRGLIYYIRSAKSMDTRIKRSLEIAEKIKTNRLSSQQATD